MRKYLWQRWHGRKGRLKALERLGIRGKALKIATTSAGAWPTAKTRPLQTALNNKYLQSAGFTLPWLLVPARRRRR